MVILITLVVLIRSASSGSVTAIVVLTTALTVLLITLGAAIALLAVKVMAHREQKAFMNNVQENLAMMKALQTVQNQQNMALLRQVKALPPGAPTLDLNQALEIEDGFFTELEDFEGTDQ